ncbi:troponin I-like protein isoform X2 [Brevipalpus obovatus]|uniref:troponin I-like protein isoform X2 n=1 Tax=Brevipalpus obovatus TaxID=246614 RepID=UPI003D9EE3CE
MDDKAKRKAEVRARLEQAAAAKKKRGFMTPARKKKLRNLLRKKAAEELKREQERRAEERRKIIRQRTGEPKSLDDCNEAKLQAILKDYYERIKKLESDKWDIEVEVNRKDFDVRELASKVNDVRGRFIKPPLKKVSKTAQQMEKIRMFTARVSQMDYRSSLKQVNKYNLDNKEKSEEKPEWASQKEKSVTSDKADN